MAERKNPPAPGPVSGLCDQCHRNPAEHRVTDVDKDGRKVDLKLCGECAQGRGLLTSVGEEPSAAAVLEDLKAKIRDDDRMLICPKCGTSYADFKKTLRLGCEDCYVVFVDRLVPVLKRIHRATRHTGHVPKQGGDVSRDFEVQRLRRELRQAIEAEDYERAASVRDRIRRAGGEEPA